MEDHLTKTPEFATNEVFYSREGVTQWVQNMGRSVGCVVVTKRSKKKFSNGEVYKVVFMCEHGGAYKSKGISSRNTGTKKFECPFELIALLSAKHNWWTLRVVCDTHNHVLAQYMEGHAYAMRLNETESQLVQNLSAQNVKPRYILATIKDTHTGNASTSRTVYNEQQKLKTINDAGRPSMQVVMDFFAKENYEFETRVNDETNKLEDLFFIHPTSLELWRAFPQVLIMDATYNTNKYNMPLLEIVGVTSTSLTFCIAFVFMHQERTSNYIWALNCLKSKIHDDFYPGAIITDRELALINACRVVFPGAKPLLCRWHVSQNIMKHCRQSIHEVHSWNSFNQQWSQLLESQNEEIYTYNWGQFQEKWGAYPGVINYLDKTWLTPYKEMLVSAWVDQVLNFGNHTTNRAESQHSKLKIYLDNKRADFEKNLSYIEQVVQSQDTSIKASFEQCRTSRRHIFAKSHFENLRGFVSFYALDLILNEHTRFFQTSVYSESCGCKLRTSYGLPCAHEQAMYTCERKPIPLDAIDMHWKKLDFSPRVSAQYDDIHCDDQVQMFRENFYKQSAPGRKNLLKKLINIMTPSTTFNEPSVHKTTRGRPSMKKTMTGDSHRRSCSNVPTFINSENLGHQESARHSSHIQRQPTPRHRYHDQIPILFHPYITQIVDVLGDGNCGFRAISACLGYHENSWDDIRLQLMYELTDHQAYYNEVIGNEALLSTYNALNFFEKNVFAPAMHWITMPEMGILTASRFNVMLHVLNMAGNVTYLPFRTQPSSTSQNVSIAIVHVDNNHYIKVILTGEYPIPTLTHHWTRYRLPDASTWITPYQNRFDVYAEFIERTHTTGYVDLSE